MSTTHSIYYFGQNFVCTETPDARLPDTTSHVRVKHTVDASACRYECVKAGKSQCNAYGFHPSDVSPNCTIGIAGQYTDALARVHRTPAGQVSIAGYCVPQSEAESNIFFPAAY